MRLLTAWLEKDYCSIIVANYGLIRHIRFVALNCIHLWKNFVNSFHLVPHALKIPELKKNSHTNQTRRWRFKIWGPELAGWRQFLPAPSGTLTARPQAGPSAVEHHWKRDTANPQQPGLSSSLLDARAPQGGLLGLKTLPESLAFTVINGAQGSRS